MRSMAGAGITPPKVLGAPKPWSSVMMSSTLGAPFGGTTRGAHQAVDSEAFSLIAPPNAGSGGGSCFPSMVMGVPGSPAATTTIDGKQLPPPDPAFGGGGSCFPSMVVVAAGEPGTPMTC